MKVTEHMILQFAGEPEITATDAHYIEQGLTRALKAIPEVLLAERVEELEKYPCCTDSDGDDWQQEHPGVWALEGDMDGGNVVSTARLLSQYGPCKGLGTW